MKNVNLLSSPAVSRRHSSSDHHLLQVELDWIYDTGSASHKVQLNILHSEVYSMVSSGPQ